MRSPHTLLTSRFLLFAAMSSAHMQLHYPAPFNATNNPHRTTPPDPYLQYPYDCCGPDVRWMYPCRGYLSLLGTDQGAPTANWEAGSRQNWSLQGIGNHYGGSCQVGFMDDSMMDGEAEKNMNGEGLFHVATSYEGNCPHRNAGDGPKGQVFHFTVPRDLVPGVRVFAWIYYNREQEFNMNCAAVNITAPSRLTTADTRTESKGNSVNRGPASRTELKSLESERRYSPLMTYTTIFTTTYTTFDESLADLTSTAFTTIHRTSTTFTITTLTASQKATDKDSESNRSLEAANSPSSVTSTCSPSSSLSSTTTTTDRDRFGGGDKSSSDSTTTVYTTISSSLPPAISTTLIGLSELRSQHATAESGMAPSDSHLGITLNSVLNPVSSAKDTTTVYSTVTMKPPEATPLLASQPAMSMAEASIQSPLLAISRSASSVPISNNRNIVYTSTAMTVVEIVTTTVGIPTSSTEVPLLFGSAAANDTQRKLQMFHTRNNCSCTCPAGNASEIEDCVCYCYQPLCNVPIRNLTTLDDPHSGMAQANSTSKSNDSIPRPDDLIMPSSSANNRHEQHKRSSEDSRPLSEFLPFHQRPLMFIADVGNGCLTPKTHWELKYPHPGPDIVPGDDMYPLELPSGNCSRQGEHI